MTKEKTGNKPKSKTPKSVDIILESGEDILDRCILSTLDVLRENLRKGLEEQKEKE